MARADNLKNMGMPKKPMAEEELDADLMGEELEGETELEEGAPLEEESPLADIADEDLINEAMMRGLLPEDFEMPGAEDSEGLEEDLEDEDELL